MANYSVSNTLAGTQQNLSTSYKTLASATSSSATQARRGQIYDIMVGTDGTPADNAIVYDLSRQTATGTATSATPTALNPADAAMLGVAAVNYTAEGTITAASSVWSIAVNQRASYRWVAAPGSEFVYPATTANGFALRAKSPAYTSTAVGTFLLTEI
jgi:hypothetical protein